MRTLFVLVCAFNFVALPVLAESDDSLLTAHTGAEAAEARPADAGDDGWVSLESGSRPAYVGIQGGTAPISLLRASDGGIFALTGNTGNDFLKVLRNDAARNGTALSAEATPPVAVPIEDDNLLPFGLSNPEGVSMAMGAAPAASEDDASDFGPAVKPLRLHSYKRVLSYKGGL